MKNIKKGLLFWIVPVLTTACSIVYIGSATKKNAGQSNNLTIDYNYFAKAIIAEKR